MPEPPYDNAPIVEAVIDFRIEESSSTSLDILRRVQESVKTEYPTAKGRYNIEGSIEVDATDVSTKTMRKQIGHVFSSAAEDQIFHSRVDGFSFSRMRPYTTWKPFQAEALRLWEIYAGVVSPKAVTRVGVRYINRIEIPDTDVVDLKNYFRTGPEVAPDLPQAIDQFFFRLQMPLPQYECRLNFASTIVETENPSTTAVILDIDVWRSMDLSLDGSLTRDLEQATSELRDAKNAVFEASITDPTRRLFG